MASPTCFTKDVSRLFLGMNLHCCQCHDHPLVDAYKQDHYYGVLAFLSRSHVFTEKTSKLAACLPRRRRRCDVSSRCSSPRSRRAPGPRLPDGPELKEPKFDKGQGVCRAGRQGAACRSSAGAPQASRTDHEQGQSAFRPLSPWNRLWFFMMGRSIVDPVEYGHPANPPSHPELLQMLSEEFIASKYDVKALVRCPSF